MATLAQTVAGSSLKISASLPATYDSAGFSALTYTSVAEVTDIGSLGKEYTLVTHNPVGDRKTYKFKGSYNNGALALKLAKAITDPGQILLTSANDSDASFSFLITTQDGRKMYFTGKVLSYVTNIGTVNNILGADVKVEIDSDIIETA
jgi:hypothetical protein